MIKTVTCELFFEIVLHNRDWFNSVISPATNYAAILSLHMRNVNIFYTTFNNRNGKKEGLNREKAGLTGNETDAMDIR